MTGGREGLLREGDDEGGDGHKGAGEGEPNARVGRDEGIAGLDFLLLDVDHIVLL